MIAGDSAGGNIAAVVTHALVAAAVRVDAQLLFYPCLDLRGFFPHQLVSPDQFSIPEMLRSGYALYLADTPDDDPVASPGLAADLSRIPASVIAVGSHDPLRHEAIAYAERLTAADVSATVMSFNLMHGFVEHYAHVSEARIAVQVRAQVLRSQMLLDHRP